MGRKPALPAFRFGRGADRARDRVAGRAACARPRDRPVAALSAGDGRRDPVRGDCAWRGLAAPGDLSAVAARSEEHTSELQSLMRISYAVFCLKKKKNENRQGNTK